jgi:hypothetical protein
MAADPAGYVKLAGACCADSIAAAGSPARGCDEAWRVRGAR